jgi:hypothetical protein
MISTTGNRIHKPSDTNNDCGSLLPLHFLLTEFPIYKSFQLFDEMSVNINNVCTTAVLDYGSVEKDVQLPI